MLGAASHEPIPAPSRSNVPWPLFCALKSRHYWHEWRIPVLSPSDDAVSAASLTFRICRTKTLRAKCKRSDSVHSAPAPAGIPKQRLEAWPPTTRSILMGTAMIVSGLGRSLAHAGRKISCCPVDQQPLSEPASARATWLPARATV